MHSDFIVGDLLISDYFLGDDVLNGGLGDDLIEGGNGNDTFIFAPGDGFDIIAKFQLDLLSIGLSQPVSPDFQIGKDKIDFTSFGYKSFSEVKTKINDDENGHALFSDKDNSILFFGISSNELTSSDFII